MALTFCSRCGAQQQEGDRSHYVGACAQATAVHQSDVGTPTGVRCPVEGCQFFLAATPDRTMVAMRQQFDLHLNWHHTNGVVSAVPRAPAVGAAAEVAALVDGFALELERRGYPEEDVTMVHTLLRRLVGAGP